MTRPAMVVHGGCGTPPAGEEDLRRHACERAAATGFDSLAAGGTALAAVEAAVRALEDEPLLNAGTGAYLQADGVAARRQHHLERRAGRRRGAGAAAATRL